MHLITVARSPACTTSFADTFFMYSHHCTRQWHGRCELDPGFGRTKTGAVRPTFKAGDVIKFEIGESSPVQIEPRQQGTYARDGSDLDVKNWTRT